MGHLQSWLLLRTIPSLEPHINAVHTASGLWHSGQLHTYILLPDILMFYFFRRDLQVLDRCSTRSPFSAQKSHEPLFTVE